MDKVSREELNIHNQNQKMKVHKKMQPTIKMRN